MLEAPERDQQSRSRRRDPDPVPIGNDVTGIGLETQYNVSTGTRADGTFPSSVPPLRAILLHNDAMVIPARAAMHRAPVDGYATYLFLLELAHAWGPAIQLPSTPHGELEGRPFHWSFWMDAGGSPAGGNAWHDNGDGTFTTGAQTPAGVQYSLLDLYIMGLASASEVPPFGALENAVAPASATDPLAGNRGVSASTFPWFDAMPLTVTATRRAVTVDDVVTQNGMRTPVFGTSPTTFDLGVVLVVGQDETPDQVAADEAVFAPIASALAPAFHTATRNRGTLDVVTANDAPLPARDGGAAADADAATSDGGAPGDAAGTASTHSGCQCAMHTTGAAGGAGAVWLALGYVAMARRRRDRAYRDPGHAGCARARLRARPARLDRRHATACPRSSASTGRT